MYSFSFLTTLILNPSSLEFNVLILKYCHIQCIHYFQCFCKPMHINVYSFFVIHSFVIKYFSSIHSEISFIFFNTLLKSKFYRQYFSLLLYNLIKDVLLKIYKKKSSLYHFQFKQTLKYSILSYLKSQKLCYFLDKEKYINHVC